MSYNPEVALTYSHWKETLRIMQEIPHRNTQLLAGMVDDLIEINKHDPATITYINDKANEFLEEVAK